MESRIGHPGAIVGVGNIDERLHFFAVVAIAVIRKRSRVPPQTERIVVVAFDNLAGIVDNSPDTPQMVRQVILRRIDYSVRCRSGENPTAAE